MKLRKNCYGRRRGIAIEMAVLVMMLVFGMCTILVSMALIQTSRKSSREIELTQRLEYDRMGESFCAAVTAGTLSDWEALYSPEGATVTAGQEGGKDFIRMEVREAGAELRFAVQLTLNRDFDAAYTITAWDYY